VSIDGDQKTHDELRPFVDGSGSYSDVSRNYQRMVDAGINCHVLITPNPNHLDDLVNITRYIIDNFSMRTITINTPFKYDTLEWSIPGAQYAKMLFDIMRIAKSKNISVDSAASPAIAAITNETRRMSACSITGDIFMSSVSPSGNLSYCAQKWHECLSIANKPLNKNDEQCKDCESFGICGGICPAFSVLSGLSYDNNKCDFMHAFLPLMAENLDLFEQEEVESDDYSQ
jgi:radical SAM protein with 4Fe4S-binding SPASM domain